jgi:Carboxypeptidase regulatory-like domain
VTDKEGVGVPDAKIEVVAMDHSHRAKAINSDQDGRFTFPQTPNGEYEIRISSAYFWHTSQLFTVVRSHQADKCTKPIQVVMKPAGQCSYVEKGWPDLKK